MIVALQKVLIGHGLLSFDCLEVTAEFMLFQEHETFLCLKLERCGGHLAGNFVVSAEKLHFTWTKHHAHCTNNR